MLFRSHDTSQYLSFFFFLIGIFSTFAVFNCNKMGKNKLARFAENKTLPNVIQFIREEALNGFYLKGKWRQDFFKNDKPIVLELGCGKGEYSVNMAKAFPDKNFISNRTSSGSSGTSSKTIRWRGSYWQVCKYPPI